MDPMHQLSSPFSASLRLLDSASSLNFPPQLLCPCPPHPLFLLCASSAAQVRVLAPCVACHRATHSHAPAPLAVSNSFTSLVRRQTHACARSHVLSRRHACNPTPLALSRP
eukprot:521869-Pleurochrysis_carterae.AAC.1